MLGLCLVVGGCLLGMAGYAFEENRASDYVQRQGPPSVASHLGECMMRALLWTTAGTAISATGVLLAAVGVVGWLVGRKGPQPPGAEPNESHRVA